MLSKQYDTSIDSNQKIITVYDRLPPPPSPTDPIWDDVAKFYLIGLGSRGQNALREFGVWDDVANVCTQVVGRKDWSPESEGDEGVEKIFKDRPCKTEVLPRDKLVGVMHDHIKENYAGKIELNYGYEVTPVDFAADGNEKVRMSVSKCDTTVRNNPLSVGTSNDEDDTTCDVDDAFFLTANMVVAADGTSRTVANEMERNDKERWEGLNVVQRLFAEKPFSIKRYEDDNRRVYKTIPMKIPSDWRPDLNYSARTKDGRINYDALPADRNGNYCGVLLVKEDDELANPNSDPVKLRALLDDSLPQFSTLLDDETVEDIAKKPVSYLPSFRYAGPRLNQGDRTLILGDCAHTVKPYFGLGANSALDDVVVLDKCLDESNKSIPGAVHLFSKKRAYDSKKLVQISRDLDRPGKIGFITFILPIILDGIFHGMLPKIFAPNTISMLQKEELTFRYVGRRKRMDRLGQVAILSVGLSGVACGAKALVRRVAKLTGRNSATVLGALSGMAIFTSLLKKLAVITNPNFSPADAANVNDKME